MNPAFWQYVTSAGISAEKCQRLMQALALSSISPTAFLQNWPELSEGERNRVIGANMAALQRATELGVEAWEQPDFRVDDPVRFPPVLWRWGPELDPDTPRVAIVGTRRASVYGQAVATKFAEALSDAGVAVGSGGALGIDKAAHEGALSGRTPTFAVLASGADVATPPSHAPLFERIRQGGGTILSQFSCGSPSLSHQFTERNQTLAALVDLVLLIEVPEASGALVTASAANNQNKPVAVVPANITMHGFRGSHQLIRDGAVLVDHPDHVLELLGTSARMPEPPALDLSETSQRIVELLGGDPLPMHKIEEATGLSSADLMAELAELELLGVVMRAGIGYALRP